MAPPRLRDERLCWLAIRDDLERVVRRRRMIDTLLTGGFAQNLVRRWESHRLSTYSFAVNRVATRLTDDERRTLRETGRVPDWFLDAVRREHRTESR